MASRNELLNDVEEAIRIALDGRQSTMWTALPGIVDSVDFDTLTVSVQPSIQATIENEDGTIQSVNLPLLINVPICFPSAGGFMITLPIAQGDEVLVILASRCIDAWWQSGGIQRPMEARMHDLSDGFAIPGPRSQPKLPGGSVSSTNAQIRNDAGTTYVEIRADGKIGLVAPAEIDITAPLVKVTGNLQVTGDSAIGGNEVVTGSIAAASAAITGAVVAGSVSSVSIVSGGKNLATHTHGAGSLTSPSGAVTGTTGAPS